MRNELLITVSKRASTLAIAQIRKVHTSVIMLTDKDGTAAINQGYKRLYGNTERIKVLQELGLLDDNDYKDMMYEQGRLEEKLNSITVNKKARQWSGNSRRAVK